MSEGSSWAARVLRDQRMPADEIGSVLEADDAEQIRRRLELHAECLRERLVDDLRTLERVERLLVAGVARPSAALALIPAAAR